MGSKSGKAPAVAAPAPAKRKPVAIDRAVEEGLLIARAALTMEVKNHIIVGALREARPYDPDEVSAFVSEQLGVLARENDDNSDRVQQLAVDVMTAGEDGRGSEGYHAADQRSLRDRGTIHERLSSELERLSFEAEYLAEIAEQAREQAWDEVGAAIQARLLRAVPPPLDKFYEEDRDARLRALIKINLRSLEHQAHKRQKQQRQQ